jgi:hypothetical protein
MDGGPGRWPDMTVHEEGLWRIQLHAVLLGGVGAMTSVSSGMGHPLGGEGMVLTGTPCGGLSCRRLPAQRGAARRRSELRWGMKISSLQWTAATDKGMGNACGAVGRRL